MQFDQQGTLKELLEVLPDAVVVADRDGRIVYVNSQTHTLFGYTEGELVGQPLEVLVPEPLRTQHVAHRTGYLAAPRKSDPWVRGSISRPDARMAACSLWTSPWGPLK